MTSNRPFHVAVTGGAGFVGSRLIAMLRSQHPEWNLTAIDNFYAGQVREIGDVTVAETDVRDRVEVETALDGADVVVHLAAISDVTECEEDPDRAYEVNVTGTSNVAWFCRKTGAALVFPFSMAVLGEPETFPITVDHPRDPNNWYGRTKLLGERVVEELAVDAFPAHLLLMSNLYGSHTVGETRVTKGTVVNFFADRALAGEPLRVHEPGTQARNFLHVDDAARAYVRSIERLRERLRAGDTGVEKFEIASSEETSVGRLAETVRQAAGDVLDRDIDVRLVENPRENVRVATRFSVDIDRANDHLDWAPRHDVRATVRRRLRRDGGT